MIRIVPDIHYKGYLTSEDIDIDDDEKYFRFTNYLRKRVKMHPVFKAPVLDQTNDFYFKRSSFLNSWSNVKEVIKQLSTKSSFKVKLKTIRDASIDDIEEEIGQSSMDT